MSSRLPDFARCLLSLCPARSSIIAKSESSPVFEVSQWEAYENNGCEMSPRKSIETIIEYMRDNKLDFIMAASRIKSMRFMRGYSPSGVSMTTLVDLTTATAKVPAAARAVNPAPDRRLQPAQGPDPPRGCHHPSRPGTSSPAMHRTSLPRSARRPNRTPH